MFVELGLVLLSSCASPRAGPADRCRVHLDRTTFQEDQAQTDCSERGNWSITFSSLLKSFYGKQQDFLIIILSLKCHSSEWRKILSVPVKMGKSCSYLWPNQSLNLEHFCFSGDKWGSSAAGVCGGVRGSVSDVWRLSQDWSQGFLESCGASQAEGRGKLNFYLIRPEQSGKELGGFLDFSDKNVPTFSHRDMFCVQGCWIFSNSL